jgi:hypothetical protein
MEPRILAACLLIVLIAVALGGGYLYLSRQGRGERRLERLAERSRKQRRKQRRADEAGSALGG